MREHIIAWIGRIFSKLNVFHWPAVVLQIMTLIYSFQVSFLHSPLPDLSPAGMALHSIDAASSSPQLLRQVQEMG